MAMPAKIPQSSMTEELQKEALRLREKEERLDAEKERLEADGVPSNDPRQALASLSASSIHLCILLQRRAWNRSVPGGKSWPLNIRPFLQTSRSWQVNLQETGH